MPKLSLVALRTRLKEANKLYGEKDIRLQENVLEYESRKKDYEATLKQINDKNINLEYMKEEAKVVLLSEYNKLLAELDSLEIQRITILEIITSLEKILLVIRHEMEAIEKVIIFLDFHINSYGKVIHAHEKFRRPVK
jgi:hypothetical protein